MTTKKAPVLSATDSEGVVWSFDPATGTCSARNGARRARAKSMQNLLPKVLDWSCQEKASPSLDAQGSPLPPPPAPPRDFVAAALSLRAVASLATSPRAFGFAPVMVRSDKTGSGSPRILRVKTIAHDGQWTSWSTGSSRPCLVSPAVAAHNVSFWKRVAAQALDVQALLVARRALAREWLAGKEDATRFLVTDRNSWKDAARSETGLHITSMVTTSTLWPTVLPGAKDPLEALEGWVQQPDGSLARSGVSLSLVPPPRTVPRAPMFFLVERMVDGQPQKVAACKDLDEAVALANATVVCQEEKWTGIDALNVSTTLLKENDDVEAGACVEGWDPVRDTAARPLYGLPTPDEYHILGAAIHGSCQQFRTSRAFSLYLLCQRASSQGQGLSWPATDVSFPHPRWVAHSSVGLKDVMWCEKVAGDAPVLAALKQLDDLHLEITGSLPASDIASELEKQSAAVLDAFHASPGSPPATDDESVSVMAQWNEKEMGHLIPDAKVERESVSVMAQWNTWFAGVWSEAQADPARQEWNDRLARVVASANLPPSPRQRHRP